MPNYLKHQPTKICVVTVFDHFCGLCVIAMETSLKKAVIKLFVEYSDAAGYLFIELQGLGLNLLVIM